MPSWSFFLTKDQLSNYSLHRERERETDVDESKGKALSCLMSWRGSIILYYT